MAGEQAKVDSNRSTEEFAQDSISWATQHGLVMRLGGTAPHAAVIHAPMTLFPTPFPREPFVQAVKLMPILNRLIDAVSRDSAFLKSVLSAAAEYDDFTAKLLELSDATMAISKQREKSEVVIGVHRSDYMLDEPSGRLLQVELNTIASSFGSLGSIVSQLHSHNVAQHPRMSAGDVPANAALAECAAALATAHHAVDLEGSVVLMVVESDEQNFYDQQWIASQLWDVYSIRTVRKTLADIASDGKLDDSGNLRCGDHRISVAYFRSGYSPSQYPSSRQWDGRRLIESSTAAKCPTVAYHLAGTKKVQQQLARPGVLEQFLPEEDALHVRKFFAGLWGLESGAEPETQQIVQEAMSHPEKFVLKPQREGGGNNLYGAEAARALSDNKDLAAYILMQRIQPPVNSSVLIRNGEWYTGDTLSELGIYGTFVRKGNDVLLNMHAGHLLRTKVASSDEGGVAAGFAVLDSPYLVD